MKQVCVILAVVVLCLGVPGLMLGQGQSEHWHLEAQCREIKIHRHPSAKESDAHRKRGWRQREIQLRRKRR